MYCLWGGPGQARCFVRNVEMRQGEVSDREVSAAIPDGPSGESFNPGLQTQKLDSSKLRVRPQKEEPRQAPTVVLDEAAYDTSIRFVLVAAVLFVLFLVLLLLSKTIK
jgi:hypothetical protein